MRPSAIFSPCDRCGIFPGARHGYKCLCHQQPGDPCYGRAVDLGVAPRAFQLGRDTAHHDPEYADVDTDGQLALGVVGDQRAIPGLARPKQEG